jgi:hypothetical protein
MRRLDRRGSGSSRVRRGRGLACVRHAVEALEGRVLLSAVTVSGDIRVAGEHDSFNYNFATPRRLYFDSMTNTNDIRWSLVGPSGTLVNNRPFAQSDSVDIGNPVIFAPAGSYSLTVDGVAETTGAYQFRLLDLADTLPITFNAETFASLNTRNTTAV